MEALKRKFENITYLHNVIPLNSHIINKELAILIFFYPASIVIRFL